MAFAAGGQLASAVSSAGGLGLIGGAYGDEAWVSEQFDVVGNQKVGCGFITWSIKIQPQLIGRVLEREPSALFLSFGNPAPFIEKIKAADVPIFCQIQTLKDARHAIDVGADIIIAQGAEAGGHGEKKEHHLRSSRKSPIIFRLTRQTLCSVRQVARNTYSVLRGPRVRALMQGVHNNNTAGCKIKHQLGLKTGTEIACKTDSGPDDIPYST